jgi:predicted ATPase
MLVEFSVENFKSFRDRVTFSMVAANITAKEKCLDEENVVEAGGGLRLLKSAAIYGANASGKSNLAAAMAFMRRFVLNSSKETQADEPTGVEPFLLSNQAEGAASSFEMVFLLDKKRYRYGFELTGECVVAEWLYFVPTTREARLFSRDRKSIALGENFREGKGLEERTRKNALFLSVAAQFNVALAEQVLLWFRNINLITTSGVADLLSGAYTLNCLDKARHSSDIVQLVKKLDLGIDGIDVETAQFDEDSLSVETPDLLRRLILERPTRTHKQIVTTHKRYDGHGRQIGSVSFDLDTHESEGTKKLVAFAGPLIHALKTGQVLFVDEFDARLHPLVTRSLISLFNSRQSNANNAQLIFTTHDTNLLTNKLFRRDQIWFVEKDRYGGTRLYSLVEYKVRNDASFESDYIRGKYGAIPFIGDISSLIGEPVAS